MQLAQFFLIHLDGSIVNYRGVQALDLQSRLQTHAAAHAPAYRGNSSGAKPRALAKETGGGGDGFNRTGGIEIAHEFSRPLRIRDDGSVVEIDGEGDESFLREAVGGLFDVGVKSPPLVQDDHAAEWGCVRETQISDLIGTEVGELNHGSTWFWGGFGFEGVGGGEVFVGGNECYGGETEP